MEREKDIEQYLVRKVKTLGGLCFKWVSPGTNGVPDRIVIYKGNVLFVEMKRKNGKPSPVQEVMAARLKEQGLRVWFLYSKKQVDTFIEWLKLIGWGWTDKPYGLN